MTPNLMPRRVHRDPMLWWLLAQPRLVLAWAGTRVTLMAGPYERTYDTAGHPTILSMIRRKA